MHTRHAVKKFNTFGLMGDGLGGYRHVPYIIRQLFSRETFAWQIVYVCLEPFMS